jgi:Flp pilus assembly protein TadD
MRFILARVVILCVGVSVSAGCARLTHGSSNRFFVNREPGVFDPKVEDTATNPETPPEPTLEEAIGKVRRLMAEARPTSKSSTPQTLEATDPELIGALALAQAMPSPKSYNEVARVYHRKQLLDRAYDYYTQSLRLKPKQAEAYEGLARVWRDWHSPALALGDAYRAIHYDPRSASARNTLGTVLQALGHRREAREAYMLVLALEPQAAYAFNNLCYLSFLDGDGERATRECQTAIRLDSRLTAARNNLGLVYAAAGRLDLAREQFALAGGAAATAYNMGVVHLAERRFQDAAREFGAAQAAFPAFAEAGRRELDARRRAAEAGTKGDK